MARLTLEIGPLPRAWRRTAGMQRLVAAQDGSRGFFSSMLGVAS